MWQTTTQNAPRPWNWRRLRIGSSDGLYNHAWLRSFFSFRTEWHMERGQGLAKAAKSAFRDGLAELRVENQGCNREHRGEPEVADGNCPRKERSWPGAQHCQGHQSGRINEITLGSLLHTHASRSHTFLFLYSSSATSTRARRIG
jgi:hypothetical protein